jgi:two-component system cell cycle sensor histidine kinase/response regulator CckA
VGPVRTIAVCDDEQTLAERTEQALRASEERYRRFFEQDLTGDFIATSAGKIVECNPAFVRMFGFTSREEARGTELGRLFPDPDSYQLLMDRLKTDRRLEYCIVEMKAINSGLVHIVGNFIASEQTDGGEETITGYVFDNTDLKRLEEQFRQAQKMEAIGQLAGGIAHDFNNLLTAIMGYLQLTLDKVKPGDPVWADLQEIRKATERAGSLTGRLLAFSRKQVLVPELLNLNTVVEEMRKLLQRIIGENIELTTRQKEDLWLVRADRGQLEQVVVNLAVNARDAMPTGGKLVIEAANAQLDQSYTKTHLGVEPGEYVSLTVSDSGVGMSREVLCRLFEPFFTTKEPGKGTGLGLATVYGIVKQSGGHISVYSEPGRGSAFRVYLPRALRKEVGACVSGPAPVGGHETILLVEDEEMVREMTARMLTWGGYTVIQAANGPEALRACKDHEGAVHLMLTDVVMPRMSGRELAEHLAFLCPRVKVIYMSGYTDDAVLQHGVYQSDMAFLQKPFTLEVLLKRVREVLDQE